MSGIDAPVPAAPHFVPVETLPGNTVTRFTEAQVAALDQPLLRKHVHQRQGSGGKSLNYLEAHFVKRTANEIFGYDGWSYATRELICLGEEPATSKTGKEGVRVGYRAVVEVRVGDVTRSDVGYGDAVEYVGSRITPHELAAKEAVSDGIKRAFASFGDRFGLVLYDKDRAA